MALIVSRRFNDSDTSLAALARLAGALPPTRVEVLPDETIPQLIFRVYNFGRSNLPRTYAEVERRIRMLNGLLTGDRLRSTKALVPTLPRWTQPLGFDKNRPGLGWSLDAENNQLMRMSTLVADVGPPTSGPFRPAIPGLPSVLSSAWIQEQTNAKGVSYAQFRLQVPDTANLTSIGTDVVYLTGALSTQYALRTPASGEDTSYVLTPDEQDAVTTAIAGATNRATVVILDTGWPTVEVAEASINWLYAAMSAVRINEVQWAKARQKWTRADYRPLQNQHARLVRAALAPLTSIDAGARRKIDVVYVPLSLAQGADSVLFDLLETYFLGRERVSGGKVSSDTARSDARRALRDVPNNLPEGAPDLGRELQSSRVVLEALNWLLREYAKRANPYVLSISWTLRSEMHFSLDVPTNYGLMVAAVGNENGEDVLETHRELGWLTQPFRTVVAVGNSSRTATPSCGSNVLTAGTNAVVTGRALMYPGALHAGQLGCGTSFSTPRVAWFLALRMTRASRADDFGNKWPDATLRDLEAATVDEKALPMRRFDVARYLRLP